MPPADESSRFMLSEVVEMWQDGRRMGVEGTGWGKVRKEASVHKDRSEEERPSPRPEGARGELLSFCMRG